jgi:transposase
VAGKSACEPWRPAIEEALLLGLSGKRIYQDLTAEQGFTGSYQSVKRFVRRLTEHSELPFRRMECAPGEEMQVDFGRGAWVLEDGRRRRPHLFRCVLSHSRKGYTEVVWRQDTETFLRCLENAFRHFGGVPLRTVIDNLKAGIIQADWFDPEINPKLADFARHYGTVILPTRPGMPRHKGKVENGVKYVQNNALKGRQFSSLGEQNQFLEQWERAVADTRIHGTVREQVLKRFLTAERPALGPLPTSLFPCFAEGKRSVHRDGYVQFDGGAYSAPPEFVGRELWVRAEARLVRLYTLKMEQIAVHARTHAGGRVTADEHIHPHKRALIERGADYLLGRCRLLGPGSGAWAQAMLQHRGPEGIRTLQGLLHLAKDHPVGDLERAAARALESGCFRLRDLRTLLAQGESVVQLGFLQAHPLIRDLSSYRVAFPT